MLFIIARYGKCRANLDRSVIKRLASASDSFGEDIVSGEHPESDRLTLATGRVADVQLVLLSDRSERTCPADSAGSDYSLAGVTEPGGYSNTNRQRKAFVLALPCCGDTRSGEWYAAGVLG